MSDKLDDALDSMMTSALTIYDVAKVLPHPYDAVADMANHWAHDFVEVALRAKKELADRDARIRQLERQLAAHYPQRWEVD